MWANKKSNFKNVTTRFVATTHPIFNDNHNVTINIYNHTHVHTHTLHPIVQYPNALQRKSKGHCYNPPCKLTKTNSIINLSLITMTFSLHVLKEYFKNQRIFTIPLFTSFSLQTDFSSYTQARIWQLLLL